MAQSDVLILLDCCSSGAAHASEGRGITEVICACPFDSKANGVGQYSFTQALTTELRLLSKKPGFSVGELYTSVYTRMQSFLAQGIENERYPPPVHFPFTQEEFFRRSIVLSIQDPQVRRGRESEANSSKRLSFENSDELGGPKKRHCLEDLSRSNTEESTPRLDESNAQNVQGDGTRASTTPQKQGGSKQENGCDDVRRSIPKDSLHPLDAPRALFAVRFKDDLRAEDLSVELFRDWLRAIPAAAEEVCIEASFKCFSTLVFITVPLSMRAYIPDNPAIFYLGTVLSPITLPLKKRELDSLQTNDEVISHTELKEDKDITKPASRHPRHDSTANKTFPSRPRDKFCSLAGSAGGSEDKLSDNGNDGIVIASPVMWDNYDILDSQRSSPGLPDPWSPGRSEISDEAFKRVGLSSLESVDSTAREHPLYHNISPHSDGLYHCPFEDDPKANCMHKPEKLKCNYEYAYFPLTQRYQY